MIKARVENKKWDGTVRVVSFLATFIVIFAPTLAWALGFLDVLTSTPAVLIFLTLVPAVTIGVYKYLKEDSGNSPHLDNESHQARIEYVWRRPFIIGCIAGLTLTAVVLFVRLQ